MFVDNWYRAAASTRKYLDQMMKKQIDISEEDWEILTRQAESADASGNEAFKNINPKHVRISEVTDAVNEARCTWRSQRPESEMDRASYVLKLKFIFSLHDARYDKHVNGTIARTK